MNEALALVAYALAAGTGGAAVLRRADWPRSLPRLGIAVWQTLCVSVLSALLLAGLAVVVPNVYVSDKLSELLDWCVMALRAQYATPGGAVLHALGAIATMSLIGRTGYLLFRGLRDARRARLSHLTELQLAAHRDPGLNALIVEHPATSAYCLPGGRTGTVVLTSAAVAALNDAELAAVLAHERAHLRGRHHLVVVGADVLARTVPFLPVFRWARDEAARLLEMAADDDAAVRADRLTVAHALVRLAEGSSVPAVALGAADTAALVRVARLLEPAQRIGFLRRTAIMIALVITAVIPVVIATAPAAVATRADYCSTSVAPAAPHGV